MSFNRAKICLILILLLVQVLLSHLLSLPTEPRDKGRRNRLFSGSQPVWKPAKAPPWLTGSSLRAHGHPLRRPHILTPAGLPGCTPWRPQAVWQLVPLTELSPRPLWPFRCPPPCEVLFSFEDLPWKPCLSIDNFCFLWQGQPTFPFSKPLHYSICSFTHSTYTFRAFVTAPGSGEGDTGNYTNKFPTPSLVTFWYAKAGNKHTNKWVNKVILHSDKCFHYNKKRVIEKSGSKEVTVVSRMIRLCGLADFWAAAKRCRGSRENSRFKWSVVWSSWACCGYKEERAAAEEHRERQRMVRHELREVGHGQIMWMVIRSLDSILTAAQSPGRVFIREVERHDLIYTFLR